MGGVDETPATDTPWPTCAVLAGHTCCATVAADALSLIDDWQCCTPQAATLAAATKMASVDAGQADQGSGTEGGRAPRPI